MKKISKKMAVIGIAIVMSGVCFGQNADTNSVTSDTNFIIEQLVKDVAVLKSKSDTTIVVKQLLEDLKRQQEMLGSLQSSRELDAETKYKIVKDNLINSVETFKLLNAKINALKSKNADNEMNVFITNLTNPQSGALGFKLDKEIKKIVSSNMPTSDKKFGEQIIETVSSITESPIIKNIPIISPAISIANSVLGVLRSVSLSKKGIDNSKINAIEKGLDNYVQYYGALNEGNMTFSFGIKSQIESLDMLHNKLYELMTVYADTLGCKTPLKNNENVGECLNTLFNTFSRKYIDDKFKQLENGNNTNGKINYDALLKNNNAIYKELNNRLDEFVELVAQFEFQYSAYLNIYDIYTSNIKNALDIAKSTNIATIDVELKKKEFEKLKKDVINRLNTDINIDDLKSSKKNIKYSVKIY